MRILITGGAGYVGSNVVAAFAEAGHDLAAVDNFATSRAEVVQILKKHFAKGLAFFETDITDPENLKHIFLDWRPDAVIHCAGLKSVAESWERSLDYYRVNVGGTLNLLAAMDAGGCKKIIFSSSALVYGEPEYLPIDEAHPLNPMNPYGRSKFMAEAIIDDWQAKGEGRQGVSLRYYNPVGAHESLLLGENPLNSPNNLFPVICEVLAGKRAELEIFGDDYPTPDGTGERDYIHISDISKAHVKAVELLPPDGFLALNLGVGTAASVKQIVACFERHSNSPVRKKIVGRRAGDPAILQADNKKSLELLGDYVSRDLESGVLSSLQYARQSVRGG